MKEVRGIAGKKGTQVGFVISFVIFVVFIFFLFVIVQPSLKTNSNSNIPQNLAAKIEGLSLDNLTTISLSITGGESKPCLQISDFFSNTGASNNMVVKDSSGSGLTASSSGGDLYVSPSVSFLKVYESDKFSPISSGAMSACQKVQNTGNNNVYKIGLLKTEQQVFVSNLAGLFQNYTNNYEQLKDLLDVPPGNEFGFSFKYNNGTVISTPTTNARVNIYAYETPVQYINENGVMQSGVINVRIW